LSEVDRLQATLARFNGSDLENQPDVIVARRNLESARADLARAESDLSKALVKSPVDGTVLKIHARPGERPSGSGLMDIANIDQMTARVEIYQTEISSVRIGASTTMTAEALGSDLNGIVARIGLEVGRQTIVDSGPAANTDARVVEVTVALDEASSLIARSYTNLQVIARIERLRE
jgi:HlyD family secretion protein